MFDVKLMFTCFLDVFINYFPKVQGSVIRKMFFAWAKIQHPAFIVSCATISQTFFALSTN